MKIQAEIFSLYKFRKSFVYYVKKKVFCGSTSSTPRDLFCRAIYISKKNGISFAANSSQILLHFGPPLMNTAYLKCAFQRCYCATADCGGEVPIINSSRCYNVFTISALNKHFITTSCILWWQTDSRNSLWNLVGGGWEIVKYIYYFALGMLSKLRSVETLDQVQNSEIQPTP